MVHVTGWILQWLQYFEKWSWVIYTIGWVLGGGHSTWNFLAWLRVGSFVLNGTVLHSSNKPIRLWQWLYHDDSAVNVVPGTVHSRNMLKSFMVWLFCVLETLFINRDPPRYNNNMVDFAFISSICVWCVLILFSDNCVCIAVTNVYLRCFSELLEPMMTNAFVARRRSWNWKISFQVSFCWCCLHLFWHTCVSEFCRWVFRI